MISCNLYLSVEQDKRLKSISKKTKVSQSVLLREALDRYLARLERGEESIGVVAVEDEPPRAARVSATQVATDGFQERTQPVPQEQGTQDTEPPAEEDELARARRDLAAGLAGLRG